MNETEVGTILKYVAGVWPNASMSKETFAVYRMELGKFDADLTIGVIRQAFGADAFPPTVLQIANAVREVLQPSIDYDEAMSELLEKIATVGYSQPEPPWSHPVIAEIVRLRGGWVEVCAQTPARAAVDAAGITTFNTWAAQCRDQLKLVAMRVDKPQRASLPAGSPLALPDLRADR